ncbi:hypothetical protein [Halalkalibacter nanhaiisediminis]|uniref:Type IV pilus assembly protein PilN n=1 Tax=Halalkalibacter nanhaiisediminis TaxID=688079 RepID=A0A562QK29_9BACI|nr:hypothetical protein [Halalkalibacter nanhaiisediminis]TWI57099.1 type IV pilus assembly protein PilN [Halalkalibacter nanhaiisediminis]
MLVEVNLLPEKNKQDVTYVFILLTTLLLIALGTTVLYFYHSYVAKEVNGLNQEVYSVQMQSTELNQQMVEEAGTELERLQQAVGELQSRVVPTSLLLDHLVRLLPERGYYLTFNYELPGTVMFDASFDRMEEIAAYHQALEQSDVVSSISLSVVEANEMLDDQEFDVNNDNVLPRYIASFTLEIHTENVKKLGDSS